jgi:alpha-L-rhamnosidase
VRTAFRIVLASLLPATLAIGLPAGASSSMEPARLTCDSLVEPLGLDDAKPRFSWQLRDPGYGARQSAYQVQIATKPALLVLSKADVWDTGKVASDRSVGVAYAGLELAPETRYYWRVKVWDKDGKQYPVSEISWWETGLMTAANWQGKWIGYETEEERRIRESGAIWITNPEQDYKGSGPALHDFRLGFDLEQPVKRAVLFVAGRVTSAAWINGKQVLTEKPVPPWKQYPWQTYTTTVVTPQLHSAGIFLR